MRNNSFRRGEASFERRRQPLAGREAAVGQKQVESRIEYIHLKEDDELNISRLDLIFQKEPREIQEKLMKLLISYNASLHYNKSTDLFEVDLLLPFLNDQEKKDFVRQFLQIRAGKKREASQDRPAQPPAEDHKEPSSHSHSNSLAQAKEIRKFSFNNNIKFASEFEEELQPEAENRLSQTQQFEQRHEEDERGSVIQNSPNEHHFQGNSHSGGSALASLENRSLNLRRIEQCISQRLRNAITIINGRRGKEERSKENENSKSMLISEEEVRREDSIIEKLAESSHFNESQRYSEDRSSFYIKEDVGDTEEPSEERLLARNHPEDHTHYHSDKFAEVIVEQTEEEDYEPLFAGRDAKARASDKVTSFEEYTKKYTTLKQQPQPKPAKPSNNKKGANQRARPQNQVSVPRNYFSSKEKQPHKQSNSSSEAQKPEQLAKQRGSKERSRQSSSHSRSLSAKRDSPSKESLQIRQHLSDFFSQHRQHLQSLYSDVRSRISGQARAAQKERPAEKERAGSQEELYILVLDDLEQEDSQSSSAGSFPHSRQFRSEMIREYKREVLRASRHLSSEELVRYFKYLHANAKKLYLKYLTARH